MRKLKLRNTFPLPKNYSSIKLGPAIRNANSILTR